ncbi:MAG: hypothetical protein ACR2MS_06865 [Weeksellaceae bacterium]
MSGLSKIVFQSAMHGHVNGVLSGLDGGSYQQGFFSGGGGSIVSSVVSGLVVSNVPGMRGISTVAAGGISAGIISKATGGTFWQGFRMGAITAGMNHVKHFYEKISVFKEHLKLAGYKWNDKPELTRDYAQKMLNNVAILKGANQRANNRAWIKGFISGDSHGRVNILTGGIELDLNSRFMSSTNYGMAVTIYHETLHLVYALNPNLLKFSGVKRDDYEHFLIFREINNLNSQITWGVNYQDLKKLKDRYGW